MNIEALFFFIVIVIISVILFVIPFIPAWIEWKEKTDAEPFNVYFEDRTIIDYIERITREFIHAHFDPLIEKCSQTDIGCDGKLNNNIEYHIVGKSGNISLTKAETDRGKTNRIFVLCKSSTLPENMNFENKIFAYENISIGEGSILSEVTAKGDIFLEKNIEIQKLVHSDTNIIIKNNCKANKFLRANGKIQFLGDAQFQYLYASQVEFGEMIRLPNKDAIDVIGKDIPRTMVSENIQIPADTDHASHYVVRKTMIIGDNCTILGNIKCYKGLSIGANTNIIGSIISEGDIFIDEGCNIQGPIVSNGIIRIDKNCVIGALNSKTSMIAKQIYISTGCFVTGQILAKIAGIYKA